MPTSGKPCHSPVGNGGEASGAGNARRSGDSLSSPFSFFSSGLLSQRGNASRTVGYSRRKRFRNPPEVSSMLPVLLSFGFDSALSVAELSFAGTGGGSDEFDGAWPTL